MDSNQLYLFKDRRFLPIFIIQFCGCLNDSILKNALITLITFKITKTSTFSSYILVMLANILFIAPFVFFASLAGQVADRYERSNIVKVIKSTEICIILLSAYGFYNVDLTILFFTLTLVGIRSTFFGPIKYSVLPDQLKKQELLGANGYIEAGTFMSIMLGTIIGGWYSPGSKAAITLTVVISVTGFLASFFVPKCRNMNCNIKINFNIIKENINIVKYAYSKNKLYLAILGISWFWFIGAAILAQIPLLTKDTIGADESVANLFLVVFSIGVGVGSFLCNRILANSITTKYVFIAAIGMSLCCIDLYFATSLAKVSYSSIHLKSVYEFLSKLYYWRILFDLFCLSAFGGFYVVPLFTVMQYFSSPAHRSRVVAANNLINSFFMVGGIAILALLFYVNFSIPSVILIISILNFIVAVRIYKLLPNSKLLSLRLIKAIFRFFFSLFYKIKLKGLENYKGEKGKKGVIIANHLSYIDPILIAVYLPESIHFAINLSISKKWWVKPFLKLVNTYPVDPNNPMAIKSLIAEVKKNKKIVIFPEGRISITGGLMKVYEGPAMIAEKAHARILPVRVNGTQYTCFSKIRKTIKTKFSLRKQISIAILAPVRLDQLENLSSKDRRKHIGQVLYDIMRDMAFETSDYKKTLFESLINSAKLFGMDRKILGDVDYTNVTYRSVIFKSFVFVDYIKKQTTVNEKVGVMLPNMTVSIVLIFAIQAIARIPVIINFTTGIENIILACTTASIKVVYTTWTISKLPELKDLFNSLTEKGIKLIYVEDYQRNIAFSSVLKASVGSLFPNIFYKYICPRKDHTLPALILFTTELESKIKAVVLSHENIQSNRCQIMAMIDFKLRDLAFNSLPFFHSFAYTSTIIMILGGVRTFLYPFPEHYKLIPEVIYSLGTTIMFGTDKFLALSGVHAHPYDFYSVRYVIAGGEKVKEKTRQTWFNKFGIRILESYGITEGSPIISLNTPMCYKRGSAGRLLPRIEYFFKPASIRHGGILCVRGPNIMLGYIYADKPDLIQVPFVEKLGKHWYDTGNTATVDQDGYLTIWGSEKRFVEISGEVISLSALEELINGMYYFDSLTAAISVFDSTNNHEQIVLFTTIKDITVLKVAKRLKELGFSELYIPKIIVKIEELPLLEKERKIDYLKLKKLAQEYNTKN